MASSLADRFQLQPAQQLRVLRLGIFGVALTLALVTVFVIWNSQGLVDQANDIYQFAELGRNVAAGEGFRFDDSPPTIRRAPLYPGLIALLYTLFGVKPVVIQLVQCLMAAGTCLLAFEIGRRVFSTRVGLIAGIMAMLHPMVMRYVPDIQVENMLTFLYTLTVYRTVRLIEDGTVLNGFWVGGAAACSAMVKGVGLPYAAFFILAYLVYRWKNKKDDERFPGVAQVAGLLLAMALVILPWTARNYQVTDGRFVLISGNASGEFLRGYVFAQPKYYLLAARAYEDGENEANQMQVDLFASQGLVREGDQEETEAVQNKAAKEKLLSDPGAFVKKFVIAWFMFWYVVTTMKNSLIVGGLALGAWVLTAIGWWSGRGRGHKFWLLMLPILSLNFIYAAILALGRYSAPAIPTLIVLAAFGVDALLRKTGRFAPAT